ncbi:MAG: gliding motility-associated C-terminal domain-containing protein [Bacteroidia bacterium]|nr:gliding motility-associated C-terminal domain-containing protein [Bacteroidia bacterium]MCO5253181.1 gliding motility-associated C-terminal domain-containing protein [Bacteroidota bacterium]MCZ2128792.1 gliding motility-associated C-terminal domain-containing protein [Bacteroidia bacterium]
MQNVVRIFTLFLIILANLYCNTARAQEGFVRNEGQWDGDFEMKAVIKSGFLFLEKQGMTWILYNSDSLHKVQHDRHARTILPVQVIKSKLLNSNPNPVIETTEASEAYFNYYLSNNRNQWRSGLRAYKQVLYKEVYPHIDLQILHNDFGIKYNFIVKTGGNPEQIRIQYEGADKLELTENGFEIKTGLGNMTEFPPYVYQEINAEKVSVPAEFTLDGNVLGFKFGKRFNRRHKLIIDPILVFSTYSGSDADNFGFTATYDLAGNGYAGGTVYNFNFTNDKGFPVSAGAYQLVYNGGVDENPGGNGSFAYPARDCGIHKYSKDGSQLLFGTFLGGSSNEQPHSMIVNSMDQLIVLGSTRSRDFPMTQNLLSYDPLVNPVTTYNIFVTIFNPNGTALIASALVGGIGDDGINGDLTHNAVGDLPLLANYADDFRGEVIVDETDNVYIASSTTSIDFPLVKPFISSYYNPQSGVAIKLNPTLSTILWSSYVGTGKIGQFNNFDAAFGIALGTDNDVFITGGTNNGAFLNGLGGYRSSMPNDKPDGYLIRVNRTSGALIAGTLIGTDEYDQSYMVKTDKEGYPYVFGQTMGKFPVTGNVFRNDGASQFVVKFEKDLKSIIFSTTIGSGRSNRDIAPTAFLIDDCGKIYVSGWGGKVNSLYGFGTGNTSLMPVSNDAFQKATDGSDFWLAVFSKDMKELIYGTYIGGKSSPMVNAYEHVDGGTSRFDARGVIYHSVCAGCGGNSMFPTTTGAFSEVNKSSNCNNALFKFDMDARNKKPLVKDTFFTVMVAQTLTFSYFGTDPDNEDILNLSFESDFINGSAPFPHIQVSSKPSTDTVWADFTWQPDCAHLTGDTIYIKVKIEDGGCPHSDSAFAIIKILVTAPPLAPGPEVLCLDFLVKNETKVEWQSFETGTYFSKAYLICRYPDGTLHLIKTITDGKGGFVMDNSNLDLKSQNYCYFIVTENICGMTDTLDFRICSKDEFESPIVGSQLITVTVSDDNKSVQVVWSKSVEDDFRSYKLYRGHNVQGAIAWKEIAEVANVNDTIYTDNRLDVSKESYCYCLQITDKCGHISDTSNMGCNIVLQGVSERWYFDLNWNPYRKWNSGVKEYVLNRSVDTGTLRPIVSLNQNKLNYRDLDLDYWWGGYYFRVDAYQQRDTNERFNAVSASNTIYLVQPPLLHVPNAFSPNHDGINELWGFVPVFVKEFNIRVYNRWGEKVFDTHDKGKQWDGNYLGDEPFDNVFIWIATYTGWDDSYHMQKGTVTVLK